MTKVDIASICYNEELLIAPWIESWLSVPFINQIYLVDACSTDKTKKIAQSYDRVSILSVKWQNDFSRQRNIALKFARNPKIKWIVQPDIDEIPCTDNFKEIGKVFNEIENVGFNQLIIPYLKFYDFTKLWFFSNPDIKPSFFDSEIWYAINKSTTTIYRKDHLKGFTKPLHEMPVLATPAKKSILSLKGKKKVREQELKDDFFLGHYDQAKHFEQARQNGTSLYYEMGMKRLRYRLISKTEHQGKVYDQTWAKNALNDLKRGIKTEVEDLGAKQLNSFLEEHKLYNSLDVTYLNNKIIRDKFIYKLGNK